MNLSVNLQVRQSQSLVMTPQLLQSIRLLQFHHVELQAFLEREAEGNPLLEILPAGSGEPVTSEPACAIETGPSPDPAAPLTGRREDADAFGDGSGADPYVAHPDAPETPFEALRGPMAGSPGGEGFDLLESLPDAPLSLHAHAVREIAEILADPGERRLAIELFGDLDDAGYLQGDAADPALPEQERLLRRLQDAAEPAGLFARGLAECLAIQLRRNNRLDPVMASVLSHLPLLARRDFAALARLTGEDEAGLLDILAEIRGLDPRPGAALSAGEAGIVVPDVVVREDAASGSWRAELNPDAFPRLSVRGDFEPRVLAGCRGGEDASFLAGCRQSAGWLQRSLDQRARTILKVASEILRRQEAFFRDGVRGLKPMTLMDVAEAVGLHESTVSRVTAGKFMASPRGTFEMRFFFTVAISASNGGEAHSAEGVKLRIQRMVAAEAPGAVLSDDDIAARLRSDGVELARRTVAKYREALGIASSVQRRREMNARRMAG